MVDENKELEALRKRMASYEKDHKRKKYYCTLSKLTVLFVIGSIWIAIAGVINGSIPLPRKYGISTFVHSYAVYPVALAYVIFSFVSLLFVIYYDGLRFTRRGIEALADKLGMASFYLVILGVIIFNIENA